MEFALALLVLGIAFVIWALTPGGQALSLRALLAEAGHATLMRASAGDTPADTWPPEAPALSALTRALRARFDPKGLFQTAGQF